MKIKQLLKKNKFISFLNDYRNSFEFNRDKLFYLKHKNNINKNKESIDFKLLLEIHKLEKGFSVISPRPFGLDKIKTIIDLVSLYEKKEYEKSFAYYSAINSLIFYQKFYEEHKWTEFEQYKIVNDFIKKNNYKINNTEVGYIDFEYDKVKEFSQIDYMNFLKSRRSIRNFSSKVINYSDIKKAVEIANYSPSACNRQMTKVYFIEDINKKKIIEEYAQGLGLFDLSNVSYTVITYDMSFAVFNGERNQGYFNAGLFCMNYINSLHSIGIGSCCIQFGNSFKDEESFKRKLNIPLSERIVVILAIGYYDKISRIPCSGRKNIDEILFKI